LRRLRGGLEGVPERRLFITTEWTLAWQLAPFFVLRTATFCLKNGSEGAKVRCKPPKTTDVCLGKNGRVERAVHAEISKKSSGVHFGPLPGFGVVLRDELSRRGPLCTCVYPTPHALSRIVI